MIAIEVNPFLNEKHPTALFLSHCLREHPLKSCKAVGLMKFSVNGFGGVV